MRSIFTRVFLAAFLLATVMTVTAAAKPGPVIFTFMERVEYHSDSNRTDGTIGDETFAYSLFSLYRKLTDNVFGSLYYLNKFSLDDSEIASNISGVSVIHKWTGKWQMTYSYSYSSNPDRTTPYLLSINNTQFAYTDSDRLSFALTYKLNPGEKKRKRYTFKTTYGTATDFCNGRTLSQKFSVFDNLTKHTDYTIAYQATFGLTDDADRGIYRSHYSNQWTVDLSYKINKTNRVVLGYQFMDNLYHGSDSVAGINDDYVIRLSYFKSFL